MTETKNQRFKRLAQKRTVNALKCIESLSNLSNKNNYEYSEYYQVRLTPQLIN